MKKIAVITDDEKSIYSTFLKVINNFEDNITKKSTIVIVATNTIGSLMVT